MSRTYRRMSYNRYWSYFIIDPIDQHTRNYYDIMSTESKWRYNNCSKYLYDGVWYARHRKFCKVASNRHIRTHERNQLSKILITFDHEDIVFPKYAPNSKGMMLSFS